MITKAEKIRIAVAVAETIREAGSIPSGHLYAMLCGTVDLDAYTSIVGVLKAQGLVREEANLLTWTGDAVLGVKRA